MPVLAGGEGDRLRCTALVWRACQELDGGLPRRFFMLGVVAVRCVAYVQSACCVCTVSLLHMYSQLGPAVWVTLRVPDNLG